MSVGSKLRKVAVGFLGLLVLGALTIGILVKFFGLRVQPDGSGMRPFFYFYKPDQHYAELEKHRASQPKPVAAATAAPAPAPAPATSAPAPRAFWAAYRGPNRDAAYVETPILTEWPKDGLPALWKQPVGGGYASFSVAGGRVFTIEQRRHQEVVAAYDLDTGRELWTHAWDAEFRETMGGDGPRATPTWDDGRLYALGATGEFRCLEAASGKKLWGRNILADSHTENLPWGMAASPLIVDDKVIVQPGGRGASVAAYRKLTGEPVWKSLDDKQAYTSPMLATLAGQRQILMVSAQRLAGLAPEDGALLWEYPWVTEYDVNGAQPVLISENRVFISSGYGHGAAVLEITQAGGKFSAKEIWKNTRMKNKFNTSVLYQGHLYGLDEGILACVDAATGDLKWKGGRYGYGQVLLASGHLIILTEHGELALVQATPEKLVELASFPALEGKTWNYPAIAGGRLLVRNTTQMAAFRIGR